MTVSNLNNCEEEEKSDSEEENGGLESFLDYIEQYEVLLSCFYTWVYNYSIWYAHDEWSAPNKHALLITASMTDIIVLLHFFYPFTIHKFLCI